MKPLCDCTISAAGTSASTRASASAPGRLDGPVHVDLGSCRLCRPHRSLFVRKRIAAYGDVLGAAFFEEVSQHRLVPLAVGDDGHRGVAQGLGMVGRDRAVRSDAAAGGPAIAVTTKMADVGDHVSRRIGTGWGVANAF